MRRIRILHLCIISALLLCLTVLSASAAWFIRPYDLGSSSYVYDSNAQEAPSTSAQYFYVTEIDGEKKLEKTYDGKAISFKLTDEAVDLFGYDTFDAGFEAEWLGVKRDVQQPDDFLTAESLFHDDVSDAYKAAIPGILGGIHHYCIREKATGQIIHDRLAVTVHKATMKATVKPSTACTFVGEKYSYNYVFTGVSNNHTLTTKEITQTVPWDAYDKGTEDDGIKKIATLSVGPPDDMVVELPDLSVDALHVNNENYIPPDVEDLKEKTASFNILPTCYTLSDSTLVYYGSLNEALYSLNDSENPPAAGTMLVAMASLSYGDGTYNATVLNTGHFEHVIGGTVEEWGDYAGDKTIHQNVTLRLPFDTTNETTAFRTDPNDPKTDEDFLNTRNLFVTYSDSKTNKSRSAAQALAMTARNIASYEDPIKDDKGNITGYNTVYCLKNEVTVAAGTELNNKGTIEIAGQVSGGNGGAIVNSMVAGEHAQIKMMDGAKIISDGTILCYGFITEASMDNGSQVIANSGSQTTVIFSLSEHRGGTKFATIYMKNRMQASAFNRFWIESISSLLTVKSGASLVGRVNLYASYSENITGIALIGQGDTYLISLGTDSYLQAKYTHTYDKDGNNDVTSTNRITKLDIYGDATINSLDISISALGRQVSLSTKDVFFPISGYYQIALHTLDGKTSAKVDSKNDLKLLPGAKLTVDEGVTLSGKNLVVYDSMHGKEHFTKENGTAGTTYQWNTSAEFTLNGSMVMDGFGGIVHTDVSGAILNVSNTSIETKELSAVVDGSLLGAYEDGNVTWTPKTYTLSLQRYQSDSSVATTFSANQPAKEYRSIEGSNAEVGWYPTTVTITFNANGGTVSPSTISGTIDANGFTPSQTLPTPTIGGDLSFVGWYTSSTLADGTEYTPTKIVDDTTLYAKWNTVMYTITLDANLGASGKPNQTYTYNNSSLTPGESSTVTTITSLPGTELSNLPVAEANGNANTSYYLAGWATSSNGTPGSSHTVSSDATLFAIWQNKVKITVTDESNNGYTITIIDPKNNEYTIVSGALTETNVFYAIEGSIVTVSPNNGTGGWTEQEITSSSTAVTIGAPSSGGGCVAAGTLITLADGTQKKVEDLVESDVLLVFDHETGQYVAAPILFIERDGWAEYTVINLTFSNGTTTRLIYEHGLFDLTLNRYVYITEQNFSSFIGHEFAVLSEHGYETVTMTDAYLTTEYTGCYSLTTAYHLNYFIDGFFSMPGGIEGLFNFFEYDENLRYDEEQMAEDIAKYGLYTYEDFAPYLPEELYYAFQAPYFKVAVGKGMITFEEIIAYIDRYLIANGLM